MGWKGTVRSLNSAIRRHEREVQRQQRELEKEAKLYAKMEERERAAHEVAVYENHIELLKSVHKQWSNLIDWKYIASSSEPKEPKNQKIRENSFKPNLITKLLGNHKKAKMKAIQEDTAEYQKIYLSWKKEYAEWEENKKLADKLLSGEEQAKIEIIEKLNPFSDISALGSSLEIDISECGTIEVELHTQGEEQIPSEIKSLLQSGKLSVKKMPKGVFYELYQDYICSCVLRVGNEILAILPDDTIIVHAMDKRLNTKTGHIEPQCILSVAIPRGTIKDLNMERIDPSDSLDNFIHNMSFKKTKGFASVEKLNPCSFLES